jgi:hypothetical protein
MSFRIAMAITDIFSTIAQFERITIGDNSFWSETTRIILVRNDADNSLGFDSK